MNIAGNHYRTIWLKKNDGRVVQVIDQRFLPHKFVTEELATVEDVAIAIKDMHIRGAGLMGAAAGYGMYIAALEANEDASEKDYDDYLISAAKKLKATRPTAVNLEWAVDRQLNHISKARDVSEKIKTALQTAQNIADEDAEFCRRIGLIGLKIIQDISDRKNGDTVNILTHCNAGWLAFVDYGSATAPMYAAFDRGIKIHVWVDETRPRNQGARLIAWELGSHGVPHTVIADNAGGHLMQHGLVDLCIVGADRVTYTGFTANKIGTYLKALAAKANNVPFYVALPSSSFDWQKTDGIKQIPIEQRDGKEISHIQGLCNGRIESVLLTPSESPTANYAFDVTPPELITGLITEMGLCQANKESVFKLYPQKRKA